MGWLATLLLNSLLGISAYWASRHAFRQPPGIARGLGAAILAWTWVTLGMLVLGNLGLIRVEALLAWASLGLAIAAGFRFLRRVEEDDAPVGDVRLDLSATVAVGLMTWVLIILLSPTIVVPVRIVSDGPIYHLYFAARWWKEQRLSLIASPFGENAATYFPAGGDLWFTWLMAALGGDRLAKIGQAPFLLMATTAAFGTARRLGAGVSSAMIATSWFVTCLPMLIFSFEANVDTIFVAGYLAAVYFLIRFALGDGDLACLALAGLAAGGAWGSKPTATAFVPALIALGGILIVGRFGGNCRSLGRIALLVLCAALPAGYWFARNAWIGGGNPLYPLQVSAFGRVLLRGWYESSAMRASQFYIDVHDYGTLAEILMVVFDPRLAPAWLACLLGAWAIGRRGRLGGWIWLCGALAALNVAIYWLLIPYRTQQRFMLQAVGLLVVPLATLLDRGRPLRWLAVGLLAVHLMTPQAWPIAGTALGRAIDFSSVVPEVVVAPITVPTSVAELHAVLSADPKASAARTQLAAGLVLGLASMVTAGLWAWASARRTPGSLALSIIATAGVLAANTWVYSTQATGVVGRFPIFRDYLRGWIELDGRTRPGTRIAYAGTNLPYLLMGPGLKNDVFYVNINAHPGWLLHDYARAARDRGEPPWPTPRPGWDRLERDYDAWIENLTEARIQVLVVCRAKPEDGLFNIADPQKFPIERAWAEAHPECFTPLYGVAEDEREIRIYGFHPPPRKNPRPIATESGPGRHQ